MAHSQSDARVIWDYLCARMRIVMRGSPRRWAVLLLVAILHLLLAMMLAHIMRESTPLVSNQAIQVQFVSVPKTVPPPLPELPPTRRQSATEPTTTAPALPADAMPAPVAGSEPEPPTPKLRLFRPDGPVNVDRKSTRL